MSTNDLVVKSDAFIDVGDVLPSGITFLSDLHFDHNRRKYSPTTASKRKKNFIKDITTECEGNSILCVAGDMYSDFKKTLAFIKEMESLKIRGFCVLGNHDYWSKGVHSYSDILSKFELATRDNQYFRLLMTGRKYYVGDLCVIGDTGWTSFRHNGELVDFAELEGLPEEEHVKDFDLSEVRDMHNDWIVHANKVYNEEENVLTMTHYPMVDFTEKPRDCWWSSTTDLRNDRGWCLFGHTHQRLMKYNNHVSHQRGYEDYTANYIAENSYSYRFSPYGGFRFGHLELAKAMTDNGHLSMVNDLFALRYDANVVSNMTDPESIKVRTTTIGRYGYKRCAANRENMAAAIADIGEYIHTVEEDFKRYISTGYDLYSYCEQADYESVRAVNAALDVLRRGDFRDVRSYMTAIVVTGYVYNWTLHFLSSMRPMNDYDIFRLWLMFLTMKEFAIDPSDIDNIRRSQRKNESVMFQGVSIPLPVINESVVSMDLVNRAIEGMPLFVALRRDGQLRLSE